MKSGNNQRKNRKKRSGFYGTAKRLRACVFRSAKAIYIQLIDDSRGMTIFQADSAKIKSKGFNIDVAKEAGRVLAEKAIKGGVKEVIFDRSGYKYHGKVRALAEGMREGGLKF